MKTHLYKEIRALDQKLYSQAVDVAEMLGNVVKAFLNGNTQAAAKTVEKDEDIDRNEIMIEEECLKLLALYQPVAGDLRYIITVLKVNGELERIGDLRGHRRVYDGCETQLHRAAASRRFRVHDRFRPPDAGFFDQSAFQP